MMNVVGRKPRNLASTGFCLKATRDGEYIEGTLPHGSYWEVIRKLLGSYWEVVRKLLGNYWESAIGLETVLWKEPSEPLL